MALLHPEQFITTGSPTTLGWNEQEYLSLNLRRWLDGSSPIPLVKVTPDLLWKMHIIYLADKMGLEEATPLFVAFDHHEWFHWTGTEWAETDECEVGDSMEELFRQLTYDTHGVEIGDEAEVGVHMLETEAYYRYFYNANPFGFKNMHPIGTTLANRKLLSCRNGLLDILTGELLPPSPYFFAIGDNGVAYDPSAECPAWTSFVSMVFPDQHDAEYIRQLFRTVMASERHSHITVLEGPQPAPKAIVAGTIADLVHDGGVVLDAIQTDDTYLEHDDVGKVAISLVSSADDWAERGLSTCGSLERFLNIHTSGLRPQVLQGAIPGSHAPWGAIDTTLALSDRPLDIDAAAANRGMGVKTITLPTLSDSLIDVLREAIADELPGILNWAVGPPHR